MEPSYFSSAMQRTEPRNWVGSVVLFPLCVYYLVAVALDGNTFLDSATVMLAGAIRSFFSLAGGTEYHLGGTLIPLVIPLLLVAFFFYHRYSFGQQVFLFWFGLILLYNGKLLQGRDLYAEAYDWFVLLRSSGLQQDAYAVGEVFLYIGLLSFIVCLLIPLFEDRSV